MQPRRVVEIDQEPADHHPDAGIRKSAHRARGRLRAAVEGGLADARRAGYGLRFAGGGVVAFDPCPPVAGGGDGDAA